MILDDENILVDSIQKDIDNNLNLIKMIKDQYGTFNRPEVNKVLLKMFNNIPDNKDTHFIKEYLEKSGWFIYTMDEYRIIITEHPIKCNGRPGYLFEISSIKTDKGLSCSIQFYEHSCVLGSLIKSYMINKYKLIQVGLGWVPEEMKQYWVSF